MTRHTRNLLSVFVGASGMMLLASTSAYALGMPDPLQYDMGVLGNWKVKGEIDTNISGWTNNSGLNAPVPGESSTTSGDIQVSNALFIFSGSNMFGWDQLGFDAWVGEPPATPVLGYVSGPALGVNLHPQCGNYFACRLTSPLFKAFATYQPLDWFSFQFGRLPSPDGTEVGVDMYNPTPFVTDLNNMQTTVADGVQVNFMSGGDKAFYYGVVPGYGSTLTIRIADGYKTGHMNELGFTGLWNLNPDGSDFIVGFGHTRWSPANSIAGSPTNNGGAGETGSFCAGGHGLTNEGNDCSAVAGFGTYNADLIGVGAQFVMGPWTFIPEVEYQWLPTDINSSTASVTPGGSDGTGHPAGTYSNLAAETTVAYQINNRWSLNGIIMAVLQNAPGNQAQCGGSAYCQSAESLGNFVGLNSGIAAGSFSAGTDLYSIEFNPTWQYHNFFIRPAINYNWISHFQYQTGYGRNGQDNNSLVGLINIGWMLGQLSD
jgi:hypothetical protein